MDPDRSIPLQLNQTSLQDFLDCPRRFELGFLNDTRWPAAYSSPLSRYEILTEIGTKFHLLCQQFFIGIDPALISSSITDPDLLILWQSFLPYGRTLLPYPSASEQILRIPYHDHYLLAKYDLIIQISSEEYLIIDWKTSPKKPSRTALANRVQTYLYPFIFQQAGKDLFAADEIQPSMIKMQYWYPLADEPEEFFPYSEALHRDSSLTIESLIAQIKDLVSSSQQFPLTDDHTHCKYCIFRSFCERGLETDQIPPGTDIESEDLSNVHFDFDLIKEIEF
jgi:hypothetical protein